MFSDFYLLQPVASLSPSLTVCLQVIFVSSVREGKDVLPASASLSPLCTSWKRQQPNKMKFTEQILKHTFYLSLVRDAKHAVLHVNTRRSVAKQSETNAK